MKRIVSIIVLALSAQVGALNAQSYADQAHKAIAAGNYDTALNLIASQIKSEASVKNFLTGLIVNSWDALTKNQQDRIPKIARARLKKADLDAINKLLSRTPRKEEERTPALGLEPARGAGKHGEEAEEGEEVKREEGPIGIGEGEQPEKYEETIDKNIDEGQYEAALEGIKTLSNDDRKAASLLKLIEHWQELSASQRKRVVTLKDDLKGSYKTQVGRKIGEAINAERNKDITSLKQQLADKQAEYDNLKQQEDELNNDLRDTAGKLNALFKELKAAEEAKAALASDATPDEIAAADKKIAAAAKKRAAYADILKQDQAKDNRILAKMKELEKDINSMHKELLKRERAVKTPRAPKEKPMVNEQLVEDLERSETSLAHLTQALTALETDFGQFAYENLGGRLAGVTQYLDTAHNNLVSIYNDVLSNMSPEEKAAFAKDQDKFMGKYKQDLNLLKAGENKFKTLLTQMNDRFADLRQGLENQIRNINMEYPPRDEQYALLGVNKAPTREQVIAGYKKALRDLPEKRSDINAARDAILSSLTKNERRADLAQKLAQLDTDMKKTQQETAALTVKADKYIADVNTIINRIG